MGVLLCLLSAAAFGAMGIFGKFAYAAGVSTDTVMLVRFCTAAVVLMGIVLLRRDLRGALVSTALDRQAPLIVRSRNQGSQAGALDRRVLGIAFLLGAIGYAAQAGFYFEALAIMDASLLSIIFYTYPLLVTIGAVALGRDRLTLRRGAALVIALAGAAMVLLSGGGMDFNLLGTLLALGTATTYTVYILISDTIINRIPPLLLAAVVMTGAAFTLTVRALIFGGVDLDVGFRGWFWLLCIALVSTVLASVAFFAGLKRVGPSSAAILSTFEPVTTTTLATLTLGEVLTGAQLVGGVLVLGAVVLIQLKTRRPRQESALVAAAAQV